MNDQKNMILAIALSALVLIGWQYFVGMPQMEKQKQEVQLRQQQTQTPGTPATTPATPGAPAQPQTQTGAPQVPGQITAPAASQQLTREAVIASTPRISIETPSVSAGKSSSALKTECEMVPFDCSTAPLKLVSNTA